MRSILTKGLLVVLFLGAYLALIGVQPQTIPSTSAVLAADAPGTVYAQPAALLSAPQQLLTAIEFVGQFPTLKQNSQIGHAAGRSKNHALAYTVRQFIRTDAYRIAAFGRTDIISPFHHFF